MVNNNNNDDDQEKQKKNALFDLLPSSVDSYPSSPQDDGHSDNRLRIFFLLLSSWLTTINCDDDAIEHSTHQSRRRTTRCVISVTTIFHVQLTRLTYPYQHKRSTRVCARLDLDQVTFSSREINRVRPSLSRSFVITSWSWIVHSEVKYYLLIWSVSISSRVQSRVIVRKWRDSFFLSWRETCTKKKKKKRRNSWDIWRQHTSVEKKQFWSLFDDVRH